MRLSGLILALVLAAAPAFAQSNFETRGNDVAFLQSDDLILSKDVNWVVGTTVTLISRPAGQTRLVLNPNSDAHFWRIRVGDYRTRTFDATADIDTTPLVETMNVTGGQVSPNHEFLAGDGPFQLSGTCPSLLGLTTDYFVEVVDADTLAFHPTEAEALAASTATRVDLGVAAVGTCTIAGMPAVPAATSTDGYTPMRLKSGDQWILPALFAPSRLSIAGSVAGAEIFYWWLP